jgi:2-succinyl-5-enolpyruvyl-6-hydroxy-3-cyclohexene-1-carboxylate synthase
MGHPASPIRSAWSRVPLGMLAVGLVMTVLVRLGLSFGASGVAQSTAFRWTRAAPVPGDARTRPSIDVIGDSITEIAAPEIAAALANDNSDIIGSPGTTIAQNLDTIKLARVLHPARDYVIELGTNDVGRNNQNWVSDFAAEVSILAREPCVALVTVGTHTPGNDAIAAGLDRAMLSTAQSRPHFHIIRWGSIEYQDPAWLRWDKVHPTTAGAVEFAHLISQRIGNC